MQQSGVHVGPASKAMERSWRRSRRAALQRQVEAFNVRVELVKGWERSVRVWEQLQEAGRRLQARLGQEVEPLRWRQDYVEGLYSRAYSAGGRYLMCKAADRPRLGLSDASRNFQRRSGRP